MTQSESMFKAEIGPGADADREALSSSETGSEGSESSARLPVISRPLLRWFTWYSRCYIRRHFHSLRVSLAGLPPDARGRAVVLYSNHASWWDALVCLIIKDEFFPERKAFAPMDAAMLERYGMFRKFGFFGVERGSRRGALQFLRTSAAILESADHLLAVTPQSRFADVRERPARFEAGLGHLAMRVEGALFVPVAVEYVFWEERLPEILLRFGDAVEVPAGYPAKFDAKNWTTLFERKLTETQDALAAEAQRRNGGDFQVVLRGGAGQGGVYDWWRGLKAKLRSESFRKEHGNK
jgi:1-acyl-sn-glycerol-3-phosphate acyltransferase